MRFPRFPTRDSNRFPDRCPPHKGFVAAEKKTHTEQTTQLLPLINHGTTTQQPIIIIMRSFLLVMALTLTSAAAFSSSPPLFGVHQKTSRYVDESRPAPGSVPAAS
jgi:hypothetical protein